MNLQGGNECVKMALTPRHEEVRQLYNSILYYTAFHCGRLKVQDYILLNIGGRERPGTGEIMTCPVCSISICDIFRRLPESTVTRLLIEARSLMRLLIDCIYFVTGLVVNGPYAVVTRPRQNGRIRFDSIQLSSKFHQVSNNGRPKGLELTNWSHRTIQALKSYMWDRYK